MNGETNGNGAIYVQVPSLKIGELRVEVASEILSLWHERQPEVFGAYLAEVLTGTKPKTRRA
jgi:hypothetical protein